MDRTIPADFCPETYLDLNPDVRSAGIDPVKHYLEHGFAENRAYRRTDISLAAHLARFSADSPIDANAFDLFEDAWSTLFRSGNGQHLTKGKFDGTNDARIDWLCSKIDLRGKNVLELGPLEAAHTVMLEKAGADVLSVEANVGAFLRCLVVKNELGLKSRFLLGDFNLLNTDGSKFSLVLASGVLYHMTNPVSFLEKFSNCTDNLFLWTHYFESDLSKWNPSLFHQLENGKWNHRHPETVDFNGLNIRIVRQRYGEALGWSGFCGGPKDYSYWIEKNDLLKLLQKLGFSRIDVSFDEPMHPNGPSLCVLARK